MTRDTAAPATIEHRIGPTGRLSIKVADWDLVLAASPDDVARVRGADGQALPDDLEVERGTDSLSIRQPSRFSDVGFVLGAQAGGRRLAIEVPAHAAVNVESASGDIAANGLRGEQRLRTASGNLRLDAAAGVVTTETDSGDIAVGVSNASGSRRRAVTSDSRASSGLGRTRS
jgi:hypothetical protein